MRKNVSMRTKGYTVRWTLLHRREIGGPIARPVNNPLRHHNYVELVLGFGKVARGGRP